MIRVYRSDQLECNCITDLTLNIQPTISLQPLSLYIYGVDRPAHMMSMINGFGVHIHCHVSRRHWYYITTWMNGFLLHTNCDLIGVNQPFNY